MADLIDNAIKNGWNKTILESQTWEQFEKDSAHKQIVIYGVGLGAMLFLKYYSDRFRVDGAVDSAKYGTHLFEYDFRPGKVYDRTIMIDRSIDISKYNPDHTVILLTVLKNYMEIYHNLGESGYRNIYSFLCMEVNKRIETVESVEYPDPREDYISYRLQTPTDPNRVFVETMGGYAGHARSVAEALQKHNGNLRFTWFNDGNTNYPNIGLKQVRKNTRSYYDALYEAGLWLYEDPVPLEIRKKKDQILIQLKHWSGITLKMFGILLEEPLEQRHNTTPGRYRRLFEHNAEITDCVITGSDFDEKTVREGYLYSGPFFRAGSPRSDILFDPERFRASVREQYGVSSDTKICLYVPTFRLDETGNCRYRDTGINFHALKDSLEKRSEEKWVIMIRLHPRTAKDTIPVFPGFVIDATDHMDGEELVAASDAVITDYSSIMFEPAFVGKPVFLFAPDLEEYLRNERGFLIPYDELPFPKADSNEELINHISGFDKKQYLYDIDTFLKRYGVHEDGHASERAAEFIMKLMRKDGDCSAGG